MVLSTVTSSSRLAFNPVWLRRRGLPARDALRNCRGNEEDQSSYMKEDMAQRKRLLSGGSAPPSE